MKSIYFRRVSNLWILDLDFETVVFFHDNIFVNNIITQPFMYTGRQSLQHNSCYSSRIDVLLKFYIFIERVNL